MLGESLLNELESKVTVRRNEPLSRHTTVGVGGTADAYVTVKDEREMRVVIAVARSHFCPVFVLGSGSNIVVSDLGIRGIVVENKNKAAEQPRATKDGYRLWAHSGISLAALARRLSFSGYSGLEWASGIPGTIGGAVVYNAGAYGGCLQDVLTRVRLLDEEGRIVEETPEGLCLGYRGSAFTRGMMRGKVVLAVELSVWPANPAKLKQKVQELDARRTAVQPKGLNAGSTFKNPLEYPAWWLIDRVGLRGHRIGDAQISDHHTNFFINLGHARAADFVALMDLAQERIQARFGISLEPEIALIGEGFHAQG